MMKGLCTVLAVAAVALAADCMAKEPPTQVVYRFDDHRYLELKGWDCQGELWYTDTKRGIHSQPYFQFYRIFTRKFIHPSERYISIPNWEVDGFLVSKDYGETWRAVGFAPGHNEPNGEKRAPPKTRCRLPSSMIRVFCKLNTGCTCHQSHLKTRGFCLAARALTIRWMTVWEAQFTGGWNLISQGMHGDWITSPKKL
ncbi:hypothetical protein [Leclercia adecarboxylata]|uniref:T6SS immunity protein Tli3 family protein n=1 Tax=Leclercia adecarboxylata TaxID=83655 RepID=UPI002E103258